MNEKIREIYSAMAEMISSGKMDAAIPLPKEIDLAEKFKTTRMNAHRAIKELEKNGFVSRKKHVGTFINKNFDTLDLRKAIKKANRTVYVLCSTKPSWIHWNELSFTALEQKLLKKKYTVTYKNIPQSNSRESYIKILEEISQKQVSALIIFPDIADTNFLSMNKDLLLDLETPILMLNRSGEALAFDMVSFVSLDPFGDGVYVGELLRKNKRNTVLMLNEETGKAFWGVKRFEGIELGLRHGNTADFSLENIPVRENEFDDFVNKIKKTKIKCAVVAVNNYYAAKLLDSAKNAGLSAPEDFELISFDDNPAYRTYNITSMAAPVKEIGELFARFVCEESWINAYRGKISIKLPGELIIRDTFKPELI